MMLRSSASFFFTSSDAELHFLLHSSSSPRRPSPVQTCRPLLIPYFFPCCHFFPIQVLITCFREDDSMPAELLPSKNGFSHSLGSNLVASYSPRTADLISGVGSLRDLNGGIGKRGKGIGNGDGGGGKGRGGGGGGGGGGGSEDDDAVASTFSPLLTILAFAAFHVGYFIAVMVKEEEAVEHQFHRFGVGLFFVTAMAAMLLHCQSGIDACILGAGAFAGVLLWTAITNYSAKVFLHQYYVEVKELLAKEDKVCLRKKVAQLVLSHFLQQPWL